MKPLGQKAYGSIPHLPGSRRGPADKGIREDQARIATHQARDKHDLVVVQEKLDGSNCCVANVGGAILALTRAGYLASTSPYEQHHLFSDWVAKNERRFKDFIQDGYRLCGEWLAQAHGTRYNLPHEPFVVFDYMHGHDRATHDILQKMAGGYDLILPRTIFLGAPVSIETMLKHLEPSGHGAIDPVEGAVWRVERKGKVDFLAKYVRQEKQDGCYLPEKTGHEAIWNWRG